MESISLNVHQSTAESGLTLLYNSTTTLTVVSAVTQVYWNRKKKRDGDDASKQKKGFVSFRLVALEKERVWK